MIRQLYCIALIALVLASCDKNKVEPSENELSYVTSIFLNEGKVYSTGLLNKDNNLTTQYWISDEKVDSVFFNSELETGIHYTAAPDEYFRKVLVHNNIDNNLDAYAFDHGSLLESGKIFYYKNGDINLFDTTAIGTITSVYVLDNIEYFTGFFGEIASGEAGPFMYPVAPFTWQENTGFTNLKVTGDFQFYGAHSIYRTNDRNVYVSGNSDVPMYWLNDEPVILSGLYGWVSEVVVSAGDVYAVGLINKQNSNSTGHTACYWKNGELVELEEDAQAFGIFVDGNDVYVSGSLGRVPADYKPCYWKNGMRVDLPL